MAERWLSAMMKLTCGCNFSFPKEEYFDYNAGQEVECEVHGETFILRLSRLGVR